jgi:hypothetical protein
VVQEITPERGQYHITSPYKILTSWVRVDYGPKLTVLDISPSNGLLDFTRHLFSVVWTMAIRTYFPVLPEPTPYFHTDFWEPSLLEILGCHSGAVDGFILG